MNATITYTLPTIQLVCHLVMLSNSSINNTDSDAIQPTLTIPVSSLPHTIELPSTIPVSSLPPTIKLPSTTPVSSLPAGYVPYPEFGVAYKVYDDWVLQSVAIEKCARDGARLAIVDSAAKVEAIRNQGVRFVFGHVGISQIRDGDTWSNIYTGSSIPQSSLPWRWNEPSSDGRCTLLENHGLMKVSCSNSANLICEIPYP